MKGSFYMSCVEPEVDLTVGSNAMTNALDVMDYGNAKDVEDRLSGDTEARRVGDDLDQQSWDDANSKLIEETSGMYPKRNLGGKIDLGRYRWGSLDEAAVDISRVLKDTHWDGRTYEGWLTAGRRQLGLEEPAS